MTPWELLECAETPGARGSLTLHRRGDEFSIRVDRRELMNSRQHASEEAMARLACALLPDAHGRVLVGGLGMGFTLAATLAAAPDAAVDVAELLPAVVRWNAGPLSGLAGHPLDNSRVTIHAGDVRDALHPGRYGAILLDVDNGPDAFTHPDNAWLYGPRGLAALRRSLTPRGVLSVWSVSPDELFSRRLRSAGFRSEAHTVRARPNGKGARHTVWVAIRT